MMQANVSDMEIQEEVHRLMRVLYLQVTAKDTQ
jgi:hypothetical protein